MPRNTFAVLTLIVMTGCTSAPKGYAEQIETAHGADAWAARDSVAASLAITFGGKPALAGEMTFETTGGRVRMELENGAVFVFDGEKAWIDEAHAAFGPAARFHLLTWPYFVALPFKLRDPGTTLVESGAMPLGGRTYDAARLTFGDGVGDSPEDWYVIYRDPETKRLEATGYIVTYGNDLAAAEEEPHAAVYSAWTNVSGVTLPTAMTFYNWTPEKGTFGEPIGSATLTGLRFVTPDASTYARPTGAVESRVPGS